MIRPSLSVLLKKLEQTRIKKFSLLERFRIRM